MSSTTALQELTFAELLSRWPQTASVLQRHRMACVGCAVAPFCTIDDALSIYALIPEQFLAELLGAIAGQEIESLNAYDPVGGESEDTVSNNESNGR